MLTKIVFCQSAFKYGDNLYNQPLHKETANKRLTEMEQCMKIWYFKEKKIYDNTLNPILDNVEKGGYYNDFIQIKLSENNILLIHVSKLREPRSKLPTKLVAVTSCFVKYGEIDRKTIKFCWIEKKRIYPENNVYTEEIWLSSNLYLVLTDRQFLKTLVIKDYKNIPLINMGANFCN